MREDGGLEGAGRTDETQEVKSTGFSDQIQSKEEGRCQRRSPGSWIRKSSRWYNHLLRQGTVEKG